MIISIRKMISMLKFLLLFAVMTLIFYYMLGLVSRWVAPADPYKVPAGHAVKAFQPEAAREDRSAPRERLRLYYWYGE